ncbi:hypothetical protein [Carnimonas bestiolae]|uniref:hypothetical protein n=1 Tax=Carnimonas bestiolae TaxID=3402172 RepID=UPI003EDC8370
MAHIPDRLFIDVLNAHEFMGVCERDETAKGTGAAKQASEWVERSHKRLAEWLLENREANIEAFDAAREKGFSF